MASNTHEESLCSDEGNSQEASKADVTDKEVKKKKETSWVHNYFTKLDGPDSNRSQCKLCHKKFASKGATTSLSYHLKNCHRLEKNSIEVGFGKQSKVEVYVKKVSKERSAAVTSAITKFIVGDMLPVDVVAGDGFKHLMQLTEPGYVIPNPTTFSRSHIPSAYDRLKKQITEELACSIRVVLTTDMWTDDYRHNSYMAVTAHFINGDWQMRSLVLCTKIFTVKHTAQNIAAALMEVVRDWGLKDKRYMIVTDAGANIKAAVTLLGWHRVSCFAHNLNLCLFTYGLKAVPEFNRLIKKCKAIVKLLRFKSAVVSQRQAELKDFYSTFVEGADHTYAVNVSPDDIGNTSLKQMVPTRWNSCLTLLKSILVNKIVINDILVNSTEVDGSEFILSSSDMTVISQLVSFLEPFKIQTDIMQAELYPTIALICPAIQTLMFHCRQAIWDSNALTELKNKVKTDLENRYPLDNTGLISDHIYRLATSLDIRFKTNRATYKTAHEFMDGIFFFGDCMGDPFPVRNAQPMAVPPDPVIVAPAAAPSSCSASKKMKISTIYGNVIETGDDEPQKDDLARLRTDIDKYLTLPRLTRVELDDLDILSWWKTNEIRFPMLANIARQVFSIVATSAPSERVFSSSGNLITKKRSRLTGPNVDKLIFLFSNLRRSKGT